MLTKIRSLVVFMLVVCGAMAAEADGLQKLSDRVYAYVGITNASPSANSFGANAGLVIGKNAALVIDTLVSEKEAQRFIADIRKVTDKPVKYVVNTHYHLDHAWGNAAFVRRGAVVIAHEKARAAAPKGAYGLAHPETFGMTAKDLEGTTLAGPTITFPDRLSVDLGDVTVELSYHGPTHTEDSIVVLIPEEKIMFTGDLLFTDYRPFLAEGDIANWRNVLADLSESAPPAMVPGHGPVSNRDDLKKMAEYLQAFDAKARELCAGKRAEDAATIAVELEKQLPRQDRAELPGMTEMNLRARYLPQPAPSK